MLVKHIYFPIKITQVLHFVLSKIDKQLIQQCRYSRILVKHVKIYDKMKQLRH